MLRECLARHGRRHRFCATLDLLLHELDLYVLDPGLDLTSKISHSHITSDLVSVDVQVGVVEIDFDFAWFFCGAESAKIDL